MGSQGGGGQQQSQFPNLGRQASSMYSLTLNEVQSQLGEPLHSMNLDELLKSVLPAEGEGPLELDLEANSSHLGSSLSIQRQASAALPKEMCSKTVDEIWRGFQQEDGGKASNERFPAHERQSTLGEMTLEDFLVKAGVVTEGLDKARTDKIGNAGSSGCTDSMASTHGYPPHGIHWLQQYHQIQPLQQQQRQVQHNIVGNYVPNHSAQQPPQGVGTSSMLDCGYSDTQMTSPSPLMGTLSDTQMPGRKRIAPGDIVEKSVERRQKRMIKNRESAARSRARKQAYTNELENKVSRLEEENEKLRRQKELDKILYSVPPPNPKFQLRRTSSSPI